MFIVQKNPKSIAAEAYRSLKTNIQYSSFDKEYKTIVITSSNPGEGKSTTSGNLALTLAEGESRVLLVDCDMRKPSMHKNFRVTNTYGIADILLQRKKVMDVAHMYNKNLSIITAGKVPPNPAEMLGSKAMSAFLEEMKEHFDYIILDTPPILPVTDSKLLAIKADATVVVVRSEISKSKHVSQAFKELEKVNANIIGTILNDVEMYSEKLYYDYSNKSKKSKFINLRNVIKI